MSRRFRGFRDLPPALFTVVPGPVARDNGFMSFRWLAAGNEAHLDIHPGGSTGSRSLTLLWPGRPHPDQQLHRPGVADRSSVAAARC